MPLNSFYDKYIQKTDSELLSILDSKDYVWEAREAAKLILKQRGSQVIREGKLENSFQNHYPEGFYLFQKLSAYDKRKLKNKLKEIQKDHSNQLIGFFALSFIAPYISTRPGREPMIESLNYWDGVLIFIALGVVMALGGFVFKSYKKTRALQSDRKRIIAAQVAEIQAFSETHGTLELRHRSVRKFKLSGFYRNPKVNDFVQIELSEFGNELIKFKVISREVYDQFNMLSNYSSNTSKKSYLKVLKESWGIRSKNTSIKHIKDALQESPATFGILFTCALIFVIMISYGVDAGKPRTTDIVNWGGNAFSLTFTDGQLWRLVTNIFIHIGVAHLFMNAIGFLFAGLLLESIIGSRNLLVLYLACGIIASLVSALWNTNVISAGASGAILGTYGFILSAFSINNGYNFKLDNGLKASIAIYVVYNLLMGLTGGIDNAAHLGGLISGILIGGIASLSKKSSN